MYFFCIAEFSSGQATCLPVFCPEGLKIAKECILKDGSYMHEAEILNRSRY